MDCNELWVGGWGLGLGLGLGFDIRVLVVKGEDPGGCYVDGGFN